MSDIDRLEMLEGMARKAESVGDNITAREIRFEINELVGKFKCE